MMKIDVDLISTQYLKEKFYNDKKHKLTPLFKKILINALLMRHLLHSENLL